MRNISLFSSQFKVLLRWIRPFLLSSIIYGPEQNILIYPNLFWTHRRTGDFFKPLKKYFLHFNLSKFDTLFSNSCESHEYCVIYLRIYFLQSSYILPIIHTRGRKWPCTTITTFFHPPNFFLNSLKKFILWEMHC